jgi:hypothetical protein
VPLTVILAGSRLERREDGRSRMGAVGGRDGGQPVTGGARGNAGRPPAVCRRCKGGSGQPNCGESPAGACARPAGRGCCLVAPVPAASCGMTRRPAPGALRAPLK